jgi:hypothetical protein
MGASLAGTERENHEKPPSKYYPLISFKGTVFEVLLSCDNSCHGCDIMYKKRTNHVIVVTGIRTQYII